MLNESERYRAFSRRAVLLAGGKAALLTALVGRMYYLQVLEADQYEMLAEENRINLRLLSPPRGRIFDRAGEPIATNRLRYRIVLIPEQANDVEETLAALGKIIKLTEAQRRRIIKKARTAKSFLPITVSENLSWAEFAEINVNTPGLSGVQPDAAPTRDYPDRDLFAHVVGYVGAVSADEAGDDPLLTLPGFKVGRRGIERTFEHRLRGRAGNSRVEVNAFGRVIREVARQDGISGEDVVLTIDRKIQDFAVKRMGAQSAAAVVMDAHSGDLIAIASTPAFDPNAFNLGLSQEYWQGLLDDPRKPLMNKCVAGQYPPGSTFKMIVALAALEAGVISSDHQVFCGGKIEFGDTAFHCWKKQGHGRLGVMDAIAQSCDVYFYDIARRTGISRIASMARRFGLGEAIGIELDGERSGLVPDKEWKLATQGVPWQQGETLIVGIGQGSLLVTPLQLAVMTSRLVNGGLAVKPRLVREVQQAGNNGSGPEPMGVSARTLDLMHKAMNLVTKSPGGTAHGSQVVRPDFSFGGKTGTAQVRRISKQEREAGLRKNEEKPWQERDHAMFVGYAPAEQPRYVVAVVVEHGGGGSRIAAPIARDILAETVKRDPSALPEFTPPPIKRSGEGEV
ncbi:MAG: penicillin-binding protein 2 [Sphingomonadales bacterium]